MAADQDERGADSVQVLSGLVSRLRAAADAVDTLAFDATTGDERTRLRGKREGVLLGLSYVEDELRTVRLDGAESAV